MRLAFTRLKHGRLAPVLLEMSGDVTRQELSDDTFTYTPVKQRKPGGDADDVRDPVTAVAQGVVPNHQRRQGNFIR